MLCNSYNIFLEKFYKLYNEASPLTTIRNAESKRLNKPWLTKGIQKSLKTKNKLYRLLLKQPSVQNKSNYKKYRNKLNHIIRIAKKSHYKVKFEQAQKNIKNMWKTINKTINKTKVKSRLPSKFKYEIRK